MNFSVFYPPRFAAADQEGTLSKLSPRLEPLKESNLSASRVVLMMLVAMHLPLDQYNHK